MSDPNKSIFKTGLISLFFLVATLEFIVNKTIPYNFRATVVKVYGKAGHGSGSIIASSDKKSLVLTNRHVCDGIAYTDEEIAKIKEISRQGMVCMFDPYSPDCLKAISDYEAFLKTINPLGRQVNIKFNNLKHKDIKGTIKRLGNKVDLCIIEVDEGNLPVMQIARNEAIPGDKIMSIGNPLYMENAQTQGFVGDEIEYQGRPYQHHTGIIFGGNSGGPVVSSDRGELVGINTLGTPDPTASYMIPLREIKKFLEE